MQNYQYDEGVISKFNAGLLQMQRLHNLQDRINSVNQNLLTFNEDFGVYNYQLLFSSLNSLLQEALPKLSEKEAGVVTKKRDIIEKYLKEYSVFTEKINPITKKPFLKLNIAHWEVHQKKLIEYESLIRIFLDKHKLNSPPEDESALF